MRLKRSHGFLNYTVTPQKHGVSSQALTTTHVRLTRGYQFRGADSTTDFGQHYQQLLQQMVVALQFKHFPKFPDVLGLILSANHQSVGSIHHNKVFHTDQRGKLMR
jgi:hypothetical protein